MTEVRTREEAIASVDQALQVWMTTFSGVLLQSRAIAQAAKNDADAAVMRQKEKVKALEQVLESSQTDEERHRLQRTLGEARELLRRYERARIRINEIDSRIGQLDRAHNVVTMSKVSDARSALSRMLLALDGYQSSARVAVGVPMSSSGLGIGRSSLSGFGLAELAVDDLDLAENPITDGQAPEGNFGHGGVKRADFRWAVQTWNDVVGPGITNGRTREDFVDRDMRSNAEQLRRTADVYDLFIREDSRIRVDRWPDGSLHIIDGRHRILIARELGIKCLPAQVSE